MEGLVLPPSPVVASITRSWYCQHALVMPASKRPDLARRSCCCHHHKVLPLPAQSLVPSSSHGLVPSSQCLVPSSSQGLELPAGPVVANITRSWYRQQVLLLPALQGPDIASSSCCCQHHKVLLLAAGLVTWCRWVFTIPMPGAFTVARSGIASRSCCCQHRKVLVSPAGPSVTSIARSCYCQHAVLLPASKRLGPATVPMSLFRSVLRYVFPCLRRGVGVSPHDNASRFGASEG